MYTHIHHSTRNCQNKLISKIILFFYSLKTIPYQLAKKNDEHCIWRTGQFEMMKKQKIADISYDMM